MKNAPDIHGIAHQALEASLLAGAVRVLMDATLEDSVGVRPDQQEALARCAAVAAAAERLSLSLKDQLQEMAYGKAPRSAQR